MDEANGHPAYNGVVTGSAIISEIKQYYNRLLWVYLFQMEGFLLRISATLFSNAEEG